MPAPLSLPPDAIARMKMLAGTPKNDKSDVESEQDDVKRPDSQKRD